MSSTFSVAAANTPQQLYPTGGRRVEFFSAQAAIANAVAVTIGWSEVGINNGLRQLAPGQGFTFNMTEEDPTIAGRITEAGQAIPSASVELARPVDLIDAGAFFAIAPGAGAILLLSTGWRQPIGGQ